jgi:hypothetical protein
MKRDIGFKFNLLKLKYDNRNRMAEMKLTKCSWLVDVTFPLSAENQSKL